MAARFAPDDWERRPEVVGRAEELRALVEPLADEDATAYGAYLADRNDANRERIVAIPAALVGCAAELAALAALVAREGNPNVRGDAAAGADLAAAAAGIAARLVAVNAKRDDPRTAACAQLALEAAAAASSADAADD